MMNTIRNSYFIFARKMGPNRWLEISWHFLLLLFSDFTSPSSYALAKICAHTMICYFSYWLLNSLIRATHKLIEWPLIMTDKTDRQAGSQARVRESMWMFATNVITNFLGCAPRNGKWKWNFFVWHNGMGRMEVVWEWHIEWCACGLDYCELECSSLCCCVCWLSDFLLIFGMLSHRHRHPDWQRYRWEGSGSSE